jgi:subtilase-type serine protease
MGFTGAGVTVAVADTGIDTTHPAFAGKIDPRSMNFVLPAPDAPYVPTQITDLDTHGTHVAGIALASGTSVTPGVAFNSNVVVLRMLASSDACKAPGADCEAEGIPNASAAALNYFASLNNVSIYNASYGPTLRKRHSRFNTMACLHDQSHRGAGRSECAGRWQDHRGG